MTDSNLKDLVRYAGILAVTFAFSCLCIKLFPTQMTIWALVVALLIACVSNCADLVLIRRLRG